MPKRARAETENEAPNQLETGGKVKNVAYGEVNKEGVAIPAVPIKRPSLDVPESERLCVVTWNLNGMRSSIEKRGDLIRKLFEKEKVDILIVTEHKITDEKKAGEVESDVRKLLKNVVDVHFEWNMSTAKKGYAGTLAIIRKDVFKYCVQVTRGIDGKASSDTEGRVITLTFPSVHVVGVYVPNSGMTLDRLQYRTQTWDKQFSDYCHKLSKEKPLVIAGDLNVARRDMDIWNVDAAHIPKLAGTTPQERSSFEKRLLGEAGLVDVFAEFYPDKTGWFSYWSVKAGNKPKNRGLRLDYVLADRKVKTLDAFILPEYSPNGDHCPVGITAHLHKAHM
jgi:exodeoxyribonuclease III